MGLANAFVAKNWKSLLSGPGSQQIRNVGDNYIKGVMKFMKNRLRIPNLIIVDDKKGDVYYHFMHQSSPQKTKVRTLETFTQLTTKGQLSSGSYY